MRNLFSRWVITYPSQCSNTGKLIPVVCDVSYVGKCHIKVPCYKRETVAAFSDIISISDIHSLMTEIKTEV